MLRFHHFEKAYKGRRILQISDFRIGPGISWVQGPNGAGKSSLFRSVCGMIPSSGEIWLEDKWELNRDPVDFRLRVNYGEAEPQYPGFLRGHDLLDFVARSKRDPARNWEKLAEQLGMMDYIGQPFSTYSSGMLKKVSLVAAFLGPARLILLDEPLITLDKASVQLLYNWIREAKAAGKSLLLSSHQEMPEIEVPIDHRLEIRDQTLHFL